MVYTRKFDSMTGKYSISKTLRMSLIPVGKTLEYFEQREYLEKDTKLKNNFAEAKKIMDNYYRIVIEDVLSSMTLSDLVEEFADSYYKKEDINEIKTKLCTEIADVFKEYKDNLFGANYVKKILPDVLTDEHEIEIIKSFSDFTTYFSGFWKIRKAIFLNAKKVNTIANRCINDNLPKFLDNIKVFEKAVDKISADIDELNQSYSFSASRASDVFSIDYFNNVLPQSGIMLYNDIVGEMNKRINLFNQTAEKHERIPKMKPLYKQILSEYNSLHEIPKEFEAGRDDLVIKAVCSEFYDENTKSLRNTIDELKNIFSAFDEYDAEKVYIKNEDCISVLSNRIIGDWSQIRNQWNIEYDKINEFKSNQKNYEEKRDELYKKSKYFSVSELEKYISSYDGEKKKYYTLAGYIKDEFERLISNVKINLEAAEILFKNPENVNLHSKFNNDILIIKELLDSVKGIEFFIKMFEIDAFESDKDEIFYADFIPCVERFKEFDDLYNRVRNYVTKKPYSTDKIKLNFENSQFLGGWDVNKQNEYLSVILIKDNYYYLALIDKNYKDVFDNIETVSNCAVYKKMRYKLLPTPYKMFPKVVFSNRNAGIFRPSDEIVKIYNDETFKKGDNFNIDDCHKIINFFKESIKKYDSWKDFDFNFKAAEEYSDISEFYNDVAEQGYSVSFFDIPASYIDALVNDGKIYLFKIYNKDMSEKSKGMPNLHTMYFKMLFETKNLKNVVYKLNGQAEMFYRPASLKYENTTVHRAHDKLKNKNPNNARKVSSFEYDLIKDKRYTEPKFLLHIPITMNFKAKGNTNINSDVIELIKSEGRSYVIGIDRGERNLIYVSVVAPDSNIVYQHSFNLIKNEYDGNEHFIDYHSLLNKREEDRKKARNNWTQIENIKNLKEGYISQVIHEICKLVVKYDAIVVMENLNAGFKRGRFKVEKQVYQKFESMLIDKLSYYVDKSIAYEDKPGGLLNAYQLTNVKTESKQNGIIFYVPAWNTSKIDPVTGFVNMLYPKYTSINASKEFLSKFDSIKYNSGMDYFEFKFNYKNFSGAKSDFRKEWTVCTYGERVEKFRNHNGKWDSRVVDITEEMKNLLSGNNIDYISGVDLKNEIIERDGKDFFEKIIKILALTLQMRNTIAYDDHVEDYIISPVMDKNGRFYDSRDYNENSSLPCDADANGAYNIARKGLIVVEKICNSEYGKKKENYSENTEWLKTAQTGDMNE